MATEAPPLTIDEPGVLEDFERVFGDELTPEAARDLEEMLAAQAAEAATPVATPVATSKPGPGKFVNLGNGLYLPVRQRIVWMRGEPESHPDWLIQTEIIRFDEGKYLGVHMAYLGGRMQEVPNVEGGLAVVQARVLVRKDDGSEGPIIGEGSAMERSEVFHDFLEKAETSAIGRALAVAGYGTEAAIDLDEGVADGNIVDAPVRMPMGVRGGDNDPNVTGPIEIKIEASAIPGVRQGGRQTQATRPQLDAIRTRVRELMMAPSKLQDIVRATLPLDPETTNDFYQEDVTDGPDGANEVLGYLAGLSFEDCGKVVLVLQGMTNA